MTCWNIFSISYQYNYYTASIWRTAIICTISKLPPPPQKKRREKRAITKSLAQYIYMTGRFRCTWSEVICAPCIIRFRISTATLPYKCRFRAYLMLLAGRRKKLSSFHKRLTPQSTRRESAPVHNERRRRPRKMVSVYFKDGGVNGSFPLFALSLSRRAAILIQRYRPPPFSSPSKKKRRRRRGVHH